MRAAIAALRRLEPGRVVVAVPVGAEETCAAFRVEADEAICARMPEPFMAVGMWYDDFSQTTDDEVRELLANSPEPADEVEGLQPRGPTSAVHEALHVEPFVGPGATS